MGLVAGVLGTLVEVQNLAAAAVLTAFFALALRSLSLLFLDPRCGSVLLAGRVLGGGLFLAGGVVYTLFAAPRLVWGLGAAGAALLVAGLVLSTLAVRSRRRRGPPGLVSLAVQIGLLLALLLIATVTLMRAGFLALTEDRPVMLVEVTGETRMELVRWAAPDQPVRDEALDTHRVVFRDPAGAAVAEAWIYGDEVAVKGRVLRLAPILNAAGVPNLFELQFAHNGYRTPDRHNELPHQAVPLPPSGPLAVHPWWRGLQRRLLARWEAGAATGSDWAIRSATTESTYFPLTDAEGRPSRGSYRLVLTPGGLTSG
ncbi:MAG TPA: hypothetical protein VN461_00385 [Vicinamibacteria bacterium]|jgi:hypothetical protein|nr:hypothetical protein [Vicinamibacteria bacterium]